MFHKSMLCSLVGILLIVFSAATEIERKNDVESVDEIEERWYDDEDLREFDRLIRRDSDKESYPNNLRLFINFPKIHRTEKRKEQQAKISYNDFDISPETSSFLLSGYRDETEDRKKTLPYEFSYVAREFYRRYTQQRVGDAKKKFYPNIFFIPENISPDNSQDYRQLDYHENTKFTDHTTTESPWKSIINAPTSGCPKGQRKDRNGRCRKTLW